MLLLLVAVEAGRICMISLSLGSAARAGVQYGGQSLITVNDTAGMQSAATADAPNLPSMIAIGGHFCKCADGTASTCLATDCAASHRVVYVKTDTSATYTPLLTWPGMPIAMTLTGKAIMRVSQ
jgi:hypothetical protein